LSRTSVPTLVLLPERDDYLPPAEADMIRAGASSREHTVTTMPGDHRTLVARAWGFEIDDLGFAGRRAPDLLAEEVAFIVELRSRLHAATGD
ncbi:MAG: hypothetical protein KDA25_09385, partial [Phycisphaerales bacterium]|nr:hypothetical protein [Phycisphaerales bacterium]